MANNNVQNVKFLRNGALLGSREAARTALETNKTLGLDGSAILARYSGGTAGQADFFIKTLVGFVYSDNANTAVTIFDIDDAGADVEKKIAEINAKLGEGITSANTATDQLSALSGTSTDGSGVTSVWGAKVYAKGYTDEQIGSLEVAEIAAGDGEFIKSVSETDGKISATTAAMPTVTEIKSEGQAIIAIKQDKGTISAATGDIAAAHVTVADSGSLIAASDVEGALAEIAAEIDGMDLAVVSGNGEVITAVSENDGKVSASKTAIKDVKLTGYVKNTAATGAISGNDDIEDALSKLENTIGSNAITNADGSITVTPANGSTTDVKVHIKSGENVIKLDANGGGIYTNLNLVEITGETLPAEIKVRYELRDSDNIKIGESIDIPKDSHIVSISYDENTQELVYTYIDVSGATKTTEIDLSHLVLEAEFASGVTFSDGVAHGVVDPTSESFLTVGASGFKISGVSGLVTNAIEALDATGGTQTIATDKHVAVEVIEADGKITTVTVVEDNIADADDLTQEIADRGAGDTALSNRLGTGVTAANTATAQLAALSGNSATAQSGDTSVEGAKKYADGKVAAVVAGLDADVSGNSTHVTVGVKEVDGVITAVTVADDDIASADALADEIAARKAVDGQNGDSYVANTSSPYISSATSLNDADVKLAGALKALSDATVNEVQVNGIALAETNNAVNVQISAVNGTGADSTPIVINTDNSTGAVTIKLEGLDCGTY